MVNGEGGRPAEEREEPTVAEDQVLLTDREQRGRDPVNEQPGRKNPAVQYRDEWQEHHGLTLGA